ncbi:Hypothetical protein PBC10988_4670 [Planctomycetales bacterium 10988]|nr:Hypothetical protein PBC10988_4670 [Planctomycetales bacterium 10988]
MPRKRELTWQTGTGNRKGRWRKKYLGKTYYFPFGTSKSDRDGYQKALAAWKIKKAEIDDLQSHQPKPHQAEYEEAIREWESALQWSLQNGDDKQAAIARDHLENLQKRLQRSIPPPLDHDDRIWGQFTSQPEVFEKLFDTLAEEYPIFRTLSAEELESGSPHIVDGSKYALHMDGTPQRIQKELWQDRIASQQRLSAPTEDSIHHWVTQYLNGKRTKVQAGELSAGRYDPIRCHLQSFENWFGKGASIKGISGKVLSDFHRELLEQINSQRISQDYAKDRMNTLKSFVHWLWKMEAIENLPRILDSNELRISKKLSTPAIFTIEEVKQLLEKAADRTKLYLLLMLNIGATQVDISDLLQDQVDWEHGYITRKRSKTQKHERVPEVRYTLWQETFSLLCQERAQNAERVLLNQNGQQLKVEELDATGRLQKIDNIASAYARLRRKTTIKKPLKLFRKTSATLIANHKSFHGLESYFLGHTPQTMSDRHYAQAPQALLEEATTWLGEQYGVK